MSATKTTSESSCASRGFRGERSIWRCFPQLCPGRRVWVQPRFGDKSLFGAPWCLPCHGGYFCPVHSSCPPGIAEGRGPPVQPIQTFPRRCWRSEGQWRLTRGAACCKSGVPASCRGGRGTEPPEVRKSPMNVYFPNWHVDLLAPRGDLKHEEGQGGDGGCESVNPAAHRRGAFWGAEHPQQVPAPSRAQGTGTPGPRSCPAPSRAFLAADRAGCASHGQDGLVYGGNFYLHKQPLGGQSGCGFVIISPSDRRGM